MINLSYIFKELIAEKTRLFLTIFAIAWGTASIAIMLAVGEGLRLNFGEAMAGAGEAIMAVQGGETSTIYRGQSINQPVLLTPTDEQLIQQSLSNVVVTAEYTFNAPMQTNKLQITNSISAVYPLYANIRNIK